MKTVINIFLIAVLSISLAACDENNPTVNDIRTPESSSENSAASSSGTVPTSISVAESEESATLPDMSDFIKLGKDYLWPVFYAGVLDTSWSMGENVEIPALVSLYANSLYLKGGEEPEPSYSAEDVEFYTQRFFDIDTDKMRGHTIFNKNDFAYSYDTSTRSEVIHVVSALSYGREDKNAEGSPIRIVIAYEVTPSEEDNTVLWDGDLELEFSSGGYKYLSNIIRFPQYTITQDVACLDELTEKYLRPLMPAYGIAWRGWATATDIPSDDLVNFCAYNNLLDLPKQTEGEPEAFVNNHAPAEATEAAIQQYFDVTAEYLRTSELYNYVSEAGEQYDNEYIMLYSFGGGGMTYALNAEEEDNLLTITVGLFGPYDELPDRPQKTSILTIRLDENGYRYLSNEIKS